MKNIFQIIILLIPLLASTVCAAQTDARLRDEMGLTRLQVVYPEAGAEIEDTMPIISADASMLETPIDPGTVVIILNGADVTDSAEITPAYVIYQPPEPLPAGGYEVRITSKDTSGNDIEPLNWKFSVKGKITAVQAAAAADNTAGRLTVSTDYVQAEYIEQQAIDISGNFREKEGMKLNADLSFSNVSTGRTIIGAFHRETQAYNDVELDKGRLDYYDSHFNSSLGNFWMRISDLTLLGAEMAGARVTKTDGPWSGTVFYGRTQDPSTSGAYKQITGGVTGDYTWSSTHKTTLTALTAWEKDGASPAPGMLPPQRDEIVGMMHEYNYSKDIKAVFEAAREDWRDMLGTKGHNGAMQLAVTGSRDAFTGELYVYSIGEGFLPVAEGSSKFLKNDREGYRGKGSWQVFRHLKVGGEYEQYDTRSTDIETKRGNAFAAVNYGALQMLQYRKAKLTSDGTVSESDSVNAVLLIPATANFTQSRITAGFQNIDYSSSGVLTETSIAMYSFNTSYRDRLGFSASYSNSETDNVFAATVTETEYMALGLNWNIIPFKLMWMGRYEIIDTSGTTVDKEEETLRNNIRYVFDDTYTFTFGWDLINYADLVSPTYDYDQSIVRSGVEWKF